MDERHDDESPINDGPWFSTRRRIIAAVGLLVIAGVLLAVVNNAIKTHKETRESYREVTKVDIKVGNGSLRLISTSDNSVSVDRKVNYTLRGPSLTQKMQGNTLIVRQNCSGLHVGECDTSYVISLPETVQTTVSSDGGSVSADSIQGSLGVQTSGGKIQVSKTFGNLELRTDSGAITGKDISSLAVTSSTKGGKVNLQFAVSPTKVNVISHDGDVTVDVPKGNTVYNVSADSANSKSTVDVKTDSNSPRSISAGSTNGKVTVATN